MSMAHGYAWPMPRVLNTHVAHVNASTGASMISGNIQLNDSCTPQATARTRNASKLNTNAMAAMATVNTINGHNGA